MLSDSEENELLAQAFRLSSEAQAAYDYHEARRLEQQKRKRDDIPSVVTKKEARESDFSEESREFKKKMTIINKQIAGINETIMASQILRLQNDVFKGKMRLCLMKRGGDPEEDIADEEMMLAGVQKRLKKAKVLLQTILRENVCYFSQLQGQGKETSI